MIAEFIPSVVFLFVTGLLLWAPFLSPHYSFFGVRVAPGFDQSDAAREARRTYWIAIVVSALAGLAWMWANGNEFASVVGAPLLLTASSTAVYAWNHRRLRAFAIAAPTVSSMDLSNGPERIPRFFWMSIGPVCVLLVTALYLHAHWAEIPDRYPIHWGAAGLPNGWATRTARGVYGQLWFAGMWMAWLIALGLASWYGSRRSPMRAAVLKVMLAVEWLFAIISPLIAASPLLHINPALIGLIVVGCVLAIVVFAAVTCTTAGNALPADQAEGGRWFAGILYLNRHDPALFVPRRFGQGYAPNLAHTLSWILFLTPIAIMLIGSNFIFQ